MYRVDLGDVFGKSILYKDDEKVEQIKKINDHLTILHFLQEKKETPIETMANILKASGKKKFNSHPLVGSSLPE
jgi:hypothetical protein